MRVLLVSPRPLEPVRKGHQVRALQLARTLVALGHPTTLLAPGHPAGDTAGGAPPADGVRRVTVRDRSGSAALGVLVAVASGRPAQAGVHGGSALAGAVAELARGVDLVVLQLARLGALAARTGGRPLVFDLVDSLALNFERRARFERAGLAALVRFEAGRLLRYERELVALARGAWVVADRDRRWLAERLEPAQAGKLVTLPLVVAAPPAARTARRDGAAPRAVITGNLGYFPTRQGALEFLAHSWPRVRARVAGCELQLAGARPPRALARAARRAGARLVADPPDLGPILAAADVALVPIEAGSGVPIKLLEAWAAEVPVVASPWAAAGAEGRPGIDHRAAATPEEWAAAVADLIERPGEAHALARAGRERLSELWSQERLDRELTRALTCL